MLHRFYIVISLICTAFFSDAQVLVSGKVARADTGEPLPGVNISVKNSFAGTSTGPQGEYSLTLPGNDYELVYTYVGMVSRGFYITADTVLDVQLEPDLLMMEGVVVTAIGIKREQKALGYSVQELPGIEMQHDHKDNFINSLTGKVAGVQVTSSSGAAGTSSYITIRGSSSIDGENQPLFILDGIPISNASGNQYMMVDNSNRAIDISPDDIESISVLKGGAATALYGIRAANGAVVITTRKAENAPLNKISTVFRTSLTFDKPSRLPGLQDRYAQGLYGMWMSGAPASWGPRLDTCSYSHDASVWQYPDFDVDGAVVSANDDSATGEKVMVYDPYEFFQTSVSQQYALELSGSTEKAALLTSATYNNSEGIIPGNRWQRFSIRMTGNVNVSEKFNLFASANYIRSTGDLAQKGNNRSGFMLGLTRTPVTFDNAAGYELDDGSQRNFRHGASYDNPYWIENKVKFYDDIDRIISYAGFEWHLSRWLKLDYKFGIDYFSQNWKNHYAIGSASYPTGMVWLAKYDERNFNSDLVLKADQKISDDWYAGISLGHNMFENRNEQLHAEGIGLEIPGFYNLMNTTSINSMEITRQVRRAAFYGVIDVSFRNMLFLSLTGRNEWSTTLPEDENSFFYPSVSLSWVFTELKPLNAITWLPFGKLRFSYARIANDARLYQTSTSFTSYSIYNTYSFTGLSFPLLGKSGFTLSDNIGNNNLKPERTSTWEIGTDLRWLSNRIAIDFTWFNQRNKDLLLNVPVSSATGYFSEYMNAGEMKTKGVEIVLALQPVRTSSWQWDAVFNFTLIRNEVIRLAPDVDMVILAGSNALVAAYAGYPYQSIFTYDWLKDQNGKVIINDDPSSNSYGFPIGNYDTLVYAGSVQPDWTLGWSNSLRWKNLSLSFLFDLKKGGKMHNGTRGSLYYFGSHSDTESREPDDLYVFEGVKQSDGSVNDIKVVKNADWYFLGEGNSFSGPASQFVEDAGWVRLREVTLNYELEGKKLGAGIIKSLTIYISGSNLWLLTPYKGIDPETSLYGSSNGQGLDYYNNPGTMGVSAGFILAL